MRKQMLKVVVGLSAAILMAGSSSASIFTGAGTDKLFSNHANWDTYPVAGGTINSFTPGSTTSGNRAQIDSAFTGFTGSNRLAAINFNYGGSGTVYAEILNGAAVQATSIYIGQAAVQTARPGDVILRTGGTMTAGNGGGGGFLQVGGTTGSAGLLTVENGSTFGASKINGTAKGTLVYDFGASAVSTLVTSDTVGTDANTFDGLLQLDLGALNTTGSYKLVDSTGAVIGGALKTWLDASAGIVSGTGNVSTANFAIVNAKSNIHWNLTMADSGQDLVFNVTAIPEPATLSLMVVSSMMLFVARCARK